MKLLVLASTCCWNTDVMVLIPTSNDEDKEYILRLAEQKARGPRHEDLLEQSCHVSPGLLHLFPSTAITNCYKLSG